MTDERPPLASGALDRDAATRATPQLLHAAWQEPGARVLRMRGVEIPVIEANAGDAMATTDAGIDSNPGSRTAVQLVSESVRLSLIPPPEGFQEAGEAEAAGYVYLGRMDDAPVFGVGVPAETGEPAVPEEPDASATNAETDAAAARGAAKRPGEHPTGTVDERWAHPFEVAAELTDTERELFAVCSALLRWNEAAGFSPRDGSETEVVLGGWGRRDARGGELFPRTDPAVIVLIEHEERILLGSNALWESGRFSLLAGFVEAGESLEQTVAREVFEEAGVRLDGIEYVTSQPWPFPRSLMLGFRARLVAGADPEDLYPDPEEISELRWFTRDELRDPAPGIILPMSVSIARWMIDRWVAEADTLAVGSAAGGVLESADARGDAIGR